MEEKIYFKARVYVDTDLPKFEREINVERLKCFTDGYNAALSEHSTKEPVAWLCEKEGRISRVVSEEGIILHYYKEHGYTITELIKKA